MFNQKGFISIELLYYLCICLLVLMLVNIQMKTLIKYDVNDHLKINQSFNILRSSLVKYQNVNVVNKQELMFDDETKIKIVNNQVYETPGFMPYFQDIKQAFFTLQDNIIFLQFYYLDKKYHQAIFYVK